MEKIITAEERRKIAMKHNVIVEKIKDWINSNDSREIIEIDMSNNDLMLMPVGNEFHEEGWLMCKRKYPKKVQILNETLKSFLKELDELGYKSRMEVKPYVQGDPGGDWTEWKPYLIIEC